MIQRSVYLAGGRSSDWREEIRLQWEETAILIDPFTDVAQGSIAEFTLGDLDQIRQCDLLFGVLDYPKAYTGMALEFGFAHALNIPCVYVHLKGERIDSMMAAVSQGVFTELQPAIDFCVRRWDF